MSLADVVTSKHVNCSFYQENIYGGLTSRRNAEMPDIPEFIIRLPDQVTQR